METENEEFVLPMIPGTEFSGEVIELGEDCKQGFDVGEKISTLLCKFSFYLLANDQLTSTILIFFSPFDSVQKSRRWTRNRMCC